MLFLKLLLALSFLYFCEGHKILAVFPMPSRSHYSLSSKLVKELANRGHEVTFVTPYPHQKPPSNIKEISVEKVEVAVNVVRKDLYGMSENSVLGMTHMMTNLGYTLTEKVLQNENVQKLLQSNEQYDLVIIHEFMDEALLGIGYHFKSPVVLVSSMPLLSWTSFLLAHPYSSSYTPNILTDYTGHMDFCQRLFNSIYDAYSILYHQWFILPKHRQLVKQHIPGGPDLYDFLNNSSLLLINAHVSSHEAQLLPPNAIEIGGFHIDEPKKLPEELQRFLDGAKNGVVVFSMGSNLKSSGLPDQKREAILKAFSKLKQDVLWKWETDELPGQSKNVKLMKWLPQADVLAHPNVKAFITHGGLLSTMESIYHGVPVIGIPVFADQKMNMANALAHGYAQMIPFRDLTEEKLSFSLNQILNDPKFKENALRKSKIMRDRPMKPTHAAMYWIEYVIRHQGAPHLRYPGMDLTWYQRNLLDVVAFVALTGVTVLFIILSLLKLVLRLFSMSRDKQKKNN